jgi:hypothetical protein
LTTFARLRRAARAPLDSPPLGFASLRGRLAAWLGAGLLIAVAVIACGRAIDQASFARIEDDMPEAEVFAILGEPTDSSSFSLGGLSATSAIWKGPEGTITIQFVNGKVALKAFSSEPVPGEE